MESLFRSEFMHLEKKGKLAWLTFTRRSKLNAINNEGTEALNQAATTISENAGIRVVVIRGQGRAFCTGIDLRQLAADQIDMGYHRRWENALHIFEQTEKIIIVGMHGYCLGGGLQLALAADIRVATADCQIGLPAIRESLIPGLATWRLPRYVGWGRAKKLVLGGENVSGEQARDIGLVDHLVSGNDFFPRLDQLAETYLKTCSTGTRMSKHMITRAFDKEYDEILPLYFQLQERAQTSLDAEEAKRAYLESREPEWQ